MFQVYILYSCLRDKYYVGYTGEELQERLRKHNSKHKGFTASTGDWSIVYSELFSDKVSAVNREKEIKSRKSRKYLVQLAQRIPS